MGVKRYQKGIKRRREERLRLLRERQRNMRDPLSTRRPQDPFYTGTSSSVYRSSFMMFRIVGALLLFTVVLIVLHGHYPQLEQAKTFIRQAMTYNVDVDQVRTAYQNLVGRETEFLPRLLAREENRKDTDDQYVLPVSGARVISTYNEKQRGIVLETGSTLPVEVVKEGWVTFVGEREGLGLTVIINHGQGEESWYGRLQEVNVQLYDWVEQGQVVGTTSVPDGQDKGILFFALRKDAQFINPLDVISFD